MRIFTTTIRFLLCFSCYIQSFSTAFTIPHHRHYLHHNPNRLSNRLYHNNQRNTFSIIHHFKYKVLRNHHTTTITTTTTTNCRNNMILSSSPSNNDHEFTSESSPLLSSPKITTTQSDLESIDSSSSSSSSGPSTNQTNKSTNEKDIISIAIPALAGLAIDPLMTLADTAFVGRASINANALAGVGSSAALLTFAFYIFNFLCTATTPLVSQRRSAGDVKGAITIGGQALTLAFGLGFMLCGFLWIFQQPLLHIMGTTNTGLEANAYASSFLTIRALAAPAVFVSSASTGILRGFLDTKTAFVIVAFANVVNFILDVILIPGMGMGPTGAAIATTCAEWICAISFIGILSAKLPSVDRRLGSNQQANQATVIDQQQFISSDTTNTPDINNNIIVITPLKAIPSFEEIKPLLIASSSVFARSLLLQISLAGAAAMAARNTGIVVEGDDSITTNMINSHNLSSSSSGVASASVAAHQIGFQLWILCSFICDALAAASQTLIADAIGRSDSKNVKSLCKTIFRYSLILGFILGGLLEIGNYSGFLITFFTQDMATQKAVRDLLPVIIASQPLNALVFSADGVIQGASEFIYEAKSMAISAVVAISSFIGFEYFGSVLSSEYMQGTQTLLHVWYSLVILQMMRGLTLSLKIIDSEGPIDILG